MSWVSWASWASWLSGGASAVGALLSSSWIGGRFVVLPKLDKETNSAQKLSQLAAWFFRCLIGSVDEFLLTVVLVPLF